MKPALPIGVTLVIGTRKTFTKRQSAAVLEQCGHRLTLIVLVCFLATLILLV